MRCSICNGAWSAGEQHLCFPGSGGGGGGGYYKDDTIKSWPTAAELLDEGKRILEERAREYEQAGGERSTAKIVAAFNAITGRDLNETEGWLFLRLLKDVRFFAGKKFHHDSGVDLVNYSALMAESKARAK